MARLKPTHRQIDVFWRAAAGGSATTYYEVAMWEPMLPGNEPSGRGLGAASERIRCIARVSRSE